MGAILAILGASLVGSIHCGAMCGGLACLYADPSVRRPGLPHALYNLGRLVAYAALGTVAGALGGGVDRFAAAAGWARIGATIAGALMIAYGLARLAVTLGVRLPSLGAGRLSRAPVARVMAWGRGRGAATRGAITGLATGLLPCGWLYAFVLTAAASGSPASGALVMAVFWAGTLPMMLAVGIGVQRGAGALGRRLPTLAAATLVAVGALTVAGRVTVDPLHAAHAHELHAGSMPHEPVPGPRSPVARPRSPAPGPRAP